VNNESDMNDVFLTNEGRNKKSFGLSIWQRCVIFWLGFKLDSVNDFSRDDLSHSSCDARHQAED